MQLALLLEAIRYGLGKHIQVVPTTSLEPYLLVCALLYNSNRKDLNVTVAMVVYVLERTILCDCRDAHKILHLGAVSAAI